MRMISQLRELKHAMNKKRTTAGALLTPTRAFARRAGWPFVAASALLTTLVACGARERVDAGTPTDMSTPEDARPIVDSALEDARADTGLLDSGARADGGSLRGTLDRSFGSAGTARIGYYELSWQPPPLVVDSSSRIVIPRSLGGTGCVGVGRLDAAGVPDTWCVDLHDNRVLPNRLAFDGDAVFATANLDDRATRVAFGRVLEDGMDPAFLAVEVALLPKPFGGRWLGPADISSSPTSVAVLRGYASTTPDRYAFAVVRYTRGGALDASFGIDGISTTNTSPNAAHTVFLVVDSAGSP